MPIIEVPGMGDVEFPDDMSDDEIASAIKANLEPKGPSSRRKGAAPVPNVGMLSGLAQSFNQGITLGGADELQAAGEAALGGGTYRDSMRRQQAERSAFSAKHPYLAAGATGIGAVTPVIMSTIGGSLAGPVGTVAGASASGARAGQLVKNALYGGGDAIRNVNTIGGAIREGARYGAGSGMVAGALSADPEKANPLLPEFLGPRAGGALEGMAIGAGVGGAVGGAVQGAQTLSQRTTPYLQKVVDFLGAERAGGTGSFANQPRGGPSGGSPITSAEAQILAKLEEAGVSPRIAAQKLEVARRAGVPLGLIDVGGQPVQRLGRAVRTVPGEGSAIIDAELSARAASQPDRVIGAVERGIGRVSTGNAGARVDALTQQARTNAGPIYKKLDTLPPIDDPGVVEVFQTPYVRQLIREADAARTGWGAAVDPLYDDAGKLLRPITFKDVDFVKQSIDDVLKPTYSAGPRPATGVDVATRSAQNLAKQLRTRLLEAADNAPGGDVYASARASFAGPSQARDMLEAGREFTRKPTEIQDVTATLAGASPAQRKWYERGVMESIRSKVDSSPDLTGSRNTLGTFWGNRADRAKLEEVVNPRRMGLLDARLSMENTAAQTRNYVQSGSQTADKAAEAIGLLGDVAKDIPTSGSSGLLARGVDATAEWLRSRVSQQTNAEIAKQLTNFRDPAAQQAFLMRLQDLQQRGALQARDVAALARAMTATDTLQ